MITKKMIRMNAVKNAAAIMGITSGVQIQRNGMTFKQMTYRFAIWRLLFSAPPRNLILARAAAKASSWNGFGCALHVRPLQVLVRVWTTRALAWPGARWHVKLRQEGPYPWASGAIAFNSCVYPIKPFVNV